MRRRAVLFVDDEKNILNALRRLFRRSAFEALFSETAEEACKILRERPVDVIVSDYRMPGMNGVEFLAQAREEYPHTIGILLTGYAELPVVMGAVNKGQVYKFVAKPWKDEELRVLITQALDLVETEEQNRKLLRRTPG